MSFLCLKSFKRFRISYRITSLPWHWDAFITWLLPSFPTLSLPTSYHTYSSHINCFRDPVWTGCTLSFLYVFIWAVSSALKVHPTNTRHCSYLAIFCSVSFNSYPHFVYISNFPCTMVWALSSGQSSRFYTLVSEFLVHVTQLEMVRHKVRFMWKIFPDSSQGILKLTFCLLLL